MRGTYTATYLSCLCSTFAKRRNLPGLDIGKAFDLIVGTSTGGIIGCALAFGLTPSEVAGFYRDHGASIFAKRLPEGLLGLPWDLFVRGRKLRQGAEALRAALEKRFGTATLGEVYAERGVALSIAAVEMTQHRSWVFKTPHLPGTNHRDDATPLVDVCMATSAAPVYRSLAVVQHTDGGVPSNRVFADGGMWANNPVLLGLLDALSMTEAGRAIEVFCLGTCPRPAGEQIPPGDVNRGLKKWKFGGNAAALSIDAQEFAYDNVARLLKPHLNRACTILRFPSDKVPAALMPYLELDDTRPEAIEALVNQARTDADMTNSRCGDPTNADGQLICRLFSEAPALVDRE